MRTTLTLKQFVHGDVLAGASSGQQLVPKLLAKIASMTELTVVILDFAGIRVATASFLREAVLGFRDSIRHRHIATVVANMNPAVIEDMSEALLARKDALLHIAGQGGTQCITPLGPLDPGLKRVIDAVLDKNEVDAISLSNTYADDAIGTTGWNNRLTTLVERGFLIEHRPGRRKQYRLILED